jgi:hypothetical protein
MAAPVDALQQAIAGDEQTIGFAFREYAGNDEPSPCTRAERPSH